MNFRNSIRFFNFLTLILMVGGMPSHAATYFNERSGLVVTYPDTFPLTCDSGVDDSGVVISLDGKPECTEKNPHMNFGGMYNAAGDETLVEHLNGGCAQMTASTNEWKRSEGKALGRNVTPPPLPGIGGLPSMTCRTDYEGGWVDVEIYAMSGVRGNDGLPVGDYHGWLHTTKDRLDSDLVQFRAVLNGLQFRGWDGSGHGAR